MTSKKYAVTGIGNAIVDIMILIQDSFLDQNALFKNSMTLITENEAKKLATLKHEKIVPGGSVANTISCLASLLEPKGGKTAFIGKIGDGKFGDIFADKLKKDNIDFFCRHRAEAGSTAKSFILISPDGHRTMATFLGCASDINDEIDEKIIADSKILYIEGYLWDKSHTIESLKKAVEIAKFNNTKVAFTLSDSFCVIRHKDEFIELAKDLDILFANEFEINFLLDMKEIENKKIADFACKNNLIISVTKSEKGAVIFDGKNSGKSYIITTHENHSVVDATGAGDGFAAGFLYGINENYPLDKCAQLGNYIAGKVITQIGPRLDQSQIKELQNKTLIVYDAMENTGN